MVLHSYVNTQSKIELQLTNVGAVAISDFCLCFSLLAPATTVSGCKITEQVGGFTRLIPTNQMPLEPGNSWACCISYREDTLPLNVAWGPKNAYITHTGKSTPVQTQPTRFAALGTNKPTSLSYPHKQLKLSPKPTLWTPTGNYCDCTSGFNTSGLKLPMAHKAWQDSSALGLRSGLTNTAQGHTLIACSINSTLHQEAYHLQIDDHSVSLEASHEHGFFYGFISLMQMHCSYDGRLPCGRIEDQPRFNWRGQHLDCARQFFDVTTLCELLDVMALLKLNQFHWHAINDEAFRFELECAPELAQRTAWRGEGQLIPGVFGGGIGPAGGSYSKGDVERLLQHARSCHLQVMAEIELPGHSLALQQVLPQLNEELSTCEDAQPESVQGYHNNTINPALDSTWLLLTPIIKELCNLFGSNHLHLGGDEVTAGCWDGSPAIDLLKQTHNLASDADVLGWFMCKAAAIVRQQGVLPAAWQESAECMEFNIGTDALVFAWQDTKSGQALLDRGFQVVMTPAQHLYFDMSSDNNSQSAGANWAATISLEDTTAWHPSDGIAGIQGALWCETIASTKDLKKALAPRIIGLAESAWCTENNTRRGADLIQAAHDFNPIWQALSWPTQRF
jgi:hexosaminidase